MNIGAIVPQTEALMDREAARAWALAVVDLGYEHVVAYDHVVGVDPEQHPEGPTLVVGRPGRWGYTYRDPFHEPLVLLGFIAALGDLGCRPGS